MLRQLDLANLKRHVPSADIGRLRADYLRKAAAFGNIIDLACNSRFRGFLENIAARQAIDELLVSHSLGSDYEAWEGVWHSEGRRMTLVSLNQTSPTIEIFLFQHGAMDWSIRMRIHACDGGQSTRDWMCSPQCLSPEAALADMARQLVNAIIA